MRRSLFVLLAILAPGCGSSSGEAVDLDAAADAPSPVDARRIECLVLPEVDGAVPVASLTGIEVGTIAWSTSLGYPSPLHGPVRSPSGRLYVSTSSRVYQLEPTGTLVGSAESNFFKEPLGRPVVRDRGDVFAAGGGLFHAYGDEEQRIQGVISVGDHDNRVGGTGEADLLVHGDLIYFTTGDGGFHIWSPEIGAGQPAPADFSPPPFGMGSFYGVRTPFAAGDVIAAHAYGAPLSDLYSATTGEALGLLVDATGEQIRPERVTGRGVFLGLPARGALDPVGALVALDNCGQELWRYRPSREKSAVPRLIGFEQQVIVRLIRRDVISEIIDLVVLSSSGEVLAGPLADADPMFVGADGTIYARRCSFGGGTGDSSIVALNADLSERWTLATGLCPDAGVLDADGMMYLSGLAPTADFFEATVIAVRTDSPGLAPTAWPAEYHDNQSTNWLELPADSLH